LKVYSVIWGYTIYSLTPLPCAPKMNQSTWRKIRGEDKLLLELNWNTVDANEERCEHKDTYYVCDGGYHAWQELVAPYKNQIDGSWYSRWSANMESVRKDVECTFGIFKKRFLILKNPIQQHVPERIEGTFITCCAIHNWLHFHDGCDDWQERGMVSEEDVAVEYGVLDQNNIHRRSRCYMMSHRKVSFMSEHAESVAHCFNFWLKLRVLY